MMWTGQIKAVGWYFAPLFPLRANPFVSRLTACGARYLPPSYSLNSPLRKVRVVAHTMRTDVTGRQPSQNHRYIFSPDSRWWLGEADYGLRARDGRGEGQGSFHRQTLSRLALVVATGSEGVAQDLPSPLFIGFN